MNIIFTQIQIILFKYLIRCVITIYPLSSLAIEQSKIHIAYNENIPPISFVEDKEKKGILIEIAHLILNKMMRYEIVEEAFPWKRGQDYVKKGLFNSHITLQTKERDTFLFFQKGYTFKSHAFIAYSKNNPRIKEIEKISSKEDLFKFTMLSHLGSGWIEEQFRNDVAIRKKVELTGKLENALKMINLQRVDLCISSNITIAKYLVKKENLKNILFKKISFLKPSDTIYKFALRKDFPNAKKILDEYDRNFFLAEKQGDIEKILKRYDVD